MGMFIFGLAFASYVLRSSGSNAFCKNLQKTDAATHRLATSYQKILRKYIKAKLEIKFPKKYKSSTIYPKFVRWKNVKSKQLKEKNCQYHTNLVNALKDRNNDLTNLTKKHDEIKIQLRQSTTWMKYHNIIYSLNLLQSSKTSIIEKRH